jgi:predicted AAA+ superfamily ATPase
MKKDVKQLAQRLLKLLPVTPSVDWTQTIAARWHADGLTQGFVPLSQLDDITLDDLLNIDDQKLAIQRNTEQFVRGFPANNVLLWGARGTGKSSLIHALLNTYASSNLRLVEVNKTQLADLANIARSLLDAPYRFVLFCDDLSFESNDSAYKELKSALEGSVFKASGNVLIYATSNRRHLLPEYQSDNQATSIIDGELHESEAVEEKISLSDRFGLWLSFYPFKQADYLAVVEHWLTKLAREYNLLGRGKPLPMDDDLRKEALRWALARGVRSGRTAQHFARQWVGERLLMRHSSTQAH